MELRWGPSLFYFECYSASQPVLSAKLLCRVHRSESLLETEHAKQALEELIAS